MSLARRLLGPVVHRTRIAAERWRSAGGAALEDAAVRAAPRLYREADRLATLPFRDSEPGRPDGELLEDLSAYTGLSADAVDELVRRRRPVDFRAEWHATPPRLRSDRWFYLSAKTYLFANAAHFAGAELQGVLALVPEGASVLEFGAGSGNLSVALARSGRTVLADELNALQRDFIRFRVERRGLAGRIAVLDPWTAVPPAAVDAITAFDVLEHLPDGATTLDERLLPALRPGGVLVENSPFVVNAANPMHYGDWGLDAHLRTRGLALEHQTPGGTRVWRAAQERPPTTSAAP